MFDCMTTTNRLRRHDERWQAEVLDALARMLDVLHDVSDAVRELGLRIEGGRSAPPDAAPVPREGPILLSVAGLTEYLGVSASTIRGLRSSGRGPVATTVGRRVFFQQADVDAWLSEQRTIVESTQPWRTAYTPGRVGGSLPRSSGSAPYCSGSNTEPLAASRYSGRGVCRVCRDDVLVNKDGRVRKHRPYFR